MKPPPRIPWCNFTKKTQPSFKWQDLSNSFRNTICLSQSSPNNPICSMYEIFTYMWLKSMANVGKYSSPMEHLGIARRKKNSLGDSCWLRCVFLSPSKFALVRGHYMTPIQTSCTIFFGKSLKITLHVHQVRSSPQKNGSHRMIPVFLEMLGSFFSLMDIPGFTKHLRYT